MKCIKLPPWAWPLSSAPPLLEQVWWILLSDWLRRSGHLRRLVYRSPSSHLSETTKKKKVKQHWQQFEWKHEYEHMTPALMDYNNNFRCLYIRAQRAGVCRLQASFMNVTLECVFDTVEYLSLCSDRTETKGSWIRQKDSVKLSLPRHLCLFCCPVLTVCFLFTPPCGYVLIPSVDLNGRGVTDQKCAEEQHRSRP